MSQEPNSNEWRVTSGVHNIDVVQPRAQWPQLVTIAISIVGLVAAGLMGYGALQTRVEHVEAAVEKLEERKLGVDRFDDVTRRLDSIEQNINELLRRTGRKR